VPDGKPFRSGVASYRLARDMARPSIVGAVGMQHEDGQTRSAFGPQSTMHAGGIPEVRTLSMERINCHSVGNLDGVVSRRKTTRQKAIAVVYHGPRPLLLHAFANDHVMRLHIRGSFLVRVGF
jgi:hypothetical protein